MKKSLIFFSLLIVSFFSFGQDKKTDSLRSVYNDKGKPDTSRLKAIHSIAWSYMGNHPDSAIILAELEFRLAEACKQNNYKGKAYNIKGICYDNKGDFARALENYFRALKIFEAMAGNPSFAEATAGNPSFAEATAGKAGMSNCYGNIGIVYKNQSNYPKALEYYLRQLKICEEIKNKKGEGNCYSSIGNIYYNQANYSKALEFYQKSLKINEGIGDKESLEAGYGNIGNIYFDQLDYVNALAYYFKSLKSGEEVGNKQGIGNCYINIGVVYLYQSDFANSVNYLTKGVQIAKEIGNQPGEGTCYVNLSALYVRTGNYKRVIQYCDSALKICIETGDVDNERLVYQNLSDAYKGIGRYKEAYESHVKFKVLTDSIFNAENSKQLGDLKTQFEVEKKETELKVKSEAEQEKLKAIASEEKKRQEVIIYSVGGVLLIVTVFSLFLYKRFRITQMQKRVIEEQKLLVDDAYESLHEKNKEVMDSIYYARRIQRALITSERYIDAQLKKLY
jgi:tetratricopeptide (TPR) repeat protein